MENITLEKIDFQNGSSGNTPLNRTNMNKIQENTQNALNKLTPIITDIENNTAENINDLIATKQFIENSMKTLQTEGTSIHVTDSADYSCKLKVEGKSEQTQTEQSANLADANVLYKQMEEFNNAGLTEKIVDNKNCIEFNNKYYRHDLGFRGLNNIKYKENTSYTIRFLGRLSDLNLESTDTLYYSVYYTDGTYNSSNHNGNGANWLEFRLVTNAEKTVSHIGFSFGSSSIWLLDKDSLCVAEGNVREYPAFVPDIPSPDYPSPIENVSGDLVVKVVGKNLFNKNDLKIGRYIDKNGVEMESAYWSSSNYINVYRNNKLSYQGISKTGDFGYNAFYDKNKNFISSFKSVLTSDIVDIPENAEYVRFCFVKASNDIETFQLELDEKQTTYEPYKEQTVTFPLGTQKLMEDGYLGDDGIHNKRKQIVLTGNENWHRQSTEHINVLNLYLILEKKGINRDSVLCSVAKQNASCGQNNDSIANICNLNSQLTNFLIDLDLNEFADITAWKAYLAEQYSAGTPVIVEYEMQEEETTAYTSEQQTAYNNLQKLKTYRTVTNISNNQDTNMQLTYKMDLQTQIAGGGSSA